MKFIEISKFMKSVRKAKNGDWYSFGSCYHDYLLMKHLIKKYESYMKSDLAFNEQKAYALKMFKERIKEWNIDPYQDVDWINDKHDILRSLKK
jgi:hypothetical protein